VPAPGSRFAALGSVSGSDSSGDDDSGGEAQPAAAPLAGRPLSAQAATWVPAAGQPEAPREAAATSAAGWRKLLSAAPQPAPGSVAPTDILARVPDFLNAVVLDYQALGAGAAEGLALTRLGLREGSVYVRPVAVGGGGGVDLFFAGARVIVPKDGRAAELALRFAHAGLAGHAPPDVMRQRLGAFVLWFGQARDTEAVRQLCPVCVPAHAPRFSAPAVVVQGIGRSSTHVIPGPRAELQIDYFDLRFGGEPHLHLTAADPYTLRVWGCPLVRESEAAASTVADLEWVLTATGRVDCVTSDGGPGCGSPQTTAWLSGLGIRHDVAPAEHHVAYQVAALSRIHGQLRPIIRAIHAESPGLSSAEALDRAMSSYNARRVGGPPGVAPLDADGAAGSYVHFSQPRARLEPAAPGAALAEAELLASLSAVQRAARSFARHTAPRAAVPSTPPPPAPGFAVGDRVLLKRPAGSYGKADPSVQGPFVVVQASGPGGTWVSPMRADGSAAGEGREVPTAFLAPTRLVAAAEDMPAGLRRVDAQEAEYVVEAILASAPSRLEGAEPGDVQLQVKWLGYEEPQWQQLAYLISDKVAAAAVDAWFRPRSQLGAARRQARRERAVFQRAKDEGREVRFLDDDDGV